MIDLNDPGFKKAMEDSAHPDIFLTVAKEMNSIGEESKKNYETIGKEFEDLKKLVDEKNSGIDPLIKEHVSKLEESITLRQDESDKAHQKRMDDLDMLIQKTPKGFDDPDLARKDAEDFKTFKINAKAISRNGEGVRFTDTDKDGISMDQFKAYKGVFEKLIRTSQPGVGYIDPDLVKDLSVGIDPDGGYTVTPVMSNRIIQRQYEMDPIRSLAAVESITTGSIQWLVDYDQAGFEWEGETDLPSDTTTPTFNQKKINVHIMATRPKATQVLLEDSGINVETWLGNHVGRRFSRGEAAAFITGNGVNQPRGFLTYDNYTTAGVDEWGRVERIAMGAAAALTADGFSNVKYSMIEELMDRGTWLMNRTTVREAMQLKDGEGRYIWQPGLQAGQRATILGLPLRMSTTMPAISAGAFSVALADWAEFYMIVDRLGITMQRDPYTQKPFVEFYFRKRVGGDVINYQAGKIGVISA
jgi:HK97 family phage major capsid protein